MSFEPQVGNGVPIQENGAIAQLPGITYLSKKSFDGTVVMTSLTPIACIIDCMISASFLLEATPAGIGNRTLSCWPPLARMPSEPFAQPASSSALLAASALYLPTSPELFW